MAISKFGNLPKDYLNQQPIPFYLIELLSIIYFGIQIVLSYITHCLTLQFASYHMICKLIALTGRILTIKHSKKANQLSNEENETDTTKPTNVDVTSNGNIVIETKDDENINKKTDEIEENKFIKESKIIAVPKNERTNDESRLKNTFGWTRINVLTMSIIFIVLASFSFLNTIESIKMLVHMENKDTTHYPLPLLACGAFGVFLNGLCYYFIGGYTIHVVGYCKFKNRPKNPFVCDDVLKMNKDEKFPNTSKTVSTSTIAKDVESLQSESKLSDFYPDGELIHPDKSKREGWYEILADISSSVFVMICGLSVHLYNTYCDDVNAKYIDPILAIISSSLLLFMMSSYMKESSMILLQTIPGTIDIHVFRKNLLEKFHEIGVHDLHIWSLTSKTYVSTVHIIFRDPSIYFKTIQNIKKYFYDQGIIQVAIQPEFLYSNTTRNSTYSEGSTDSQNYDMKNLSCIECLVPCLLKECAEKSCCGPNCQLKEVKTECCKAKNDQKQNSHIKSIVIVDQNQALETLNVKSLINGTKSNGALKLNDKNKNNIKINKNSEIKTDELNGNFKMLENNIK